MLVLIVTADVKKYKGFYFTLKINFRAKLGVHKKKMTKTADIKHRVKIKRSIFFNTI